MAIRQRTGYRPAYENEKLITLLFCRALQFSKLGLRLCEQRGGLIIIDRRRDTCVEPQFRDIETLLAADKRAFCKVDAFLARANAIIGGRVAVRLSRDIAGARLR